MRMMQIVRGSTAISILICSLVCVLSGCQTATARRVSTRSFDEIQPGVTTASWLRTTLGDPAAKQRQNDHVERWEWIYRTRENPDGSCLIVFYGREAKAANRLPPPADRGQCYAEVKDGIVERLTMTDPNANFGGEWASGINTRTGSATRTVWMEWEEQSWDVR